MPNSSITVQVPLDRKFLSDLMITAFDMPYGGCWYWAQPAGEDVIEGPDHGLAEGQGHDVWYAINIEDPSDETDEGQGKRYRVDHGVVAEGIQKILSDPKDRDHSTLLEAVATKDSGMVDSDLVDRIVQIGLWQEVQYG